MLKVAFEDFRCFSRSNPLEIRPITFLVGENSAGKTSFLAGVRFLLEVFSGPGATPFNKDSYFLGGFEQIAHYRGGRGGRAKTFQLSLEVPDVLETSSMSGTPRRRNQTESRRTNTRHNFTFSKGYPQPRLSGYSFQSGDIATSISLDAGPVQVLLRNGNHQEHLLYEENGLHSGIQENHGFLQYLFQHVEYSITRRDDRDDVDLYTRIGVPRERMDRFWHSFRDSSRRLSQDGFASAPVRTQPSRTYTPSELLASSEGSHVPLEFARAKRRQPEQWKAIKTNLEQFGRASGLFSEIDIRNFGRNDIDPFQIQVKINGPLMNLVDVGYGVSQALPLVPAALVIATAWPRSTNWN